MVADNREIVQPTAYSTIRYVNFHRDQNYWENLNSYLLDGINKRRYNYQMPNLTPNAESPLAKNAKALTTNITAI